MKLNQVQYDAIIAFRDLFPAKRCRNLKIRNWRDALLIAWMNDWPEQRGELRSLRNSPHFDSLQAIFDAFDTH